MTDLFPMYQKGGFDYPAAMALATLLGIGFGFSLERGGFGRSTILSAQFYNTNMRVLKVMFSAIATTAVGIGIFSGLGMLDVSAIQTPTTWIWPQVIGGSLLGVGFVISGYCPGTAVVATASGHIDGIVAMVGIMIGALIFGFGYPAFESMYTSSGMGVQQIHTLIGVPWSVAAVGVVAIAMGAFVVGEIVEAKMAKKLNTEAPLSDPLKRKRFFIALGGASVAGLLTIVVGPTLKQEAPPLIEQISASALANTLITDPTGVFVVDLRTAEACAKRRVPNALCLPEGGATKAFFADLPSTRQLVIYGATDLKDAPAEVGEFGGRIFAITGGLETFTKEVLTKPAPPTEATPDALAAWQARNAAYAFFSGAKVAPPPKMPTRKAVKRAVRKGGGC